MGKIGIEPIMFTARERIYSPPQHRQSLPLSQECLFGLDTSLQDKTEPNQHHDVVIQPNHRPSACKQRNSNRIKAERPESNRRPERDSVSFPLAYIPHNPDSRVSKVFYVSCLPRVVSLFRIFIFFSKKRHE